MRTDRGRVPRWSWLVAVASGLGGLGLLLRAVSGSAGGVVGRVLAAGAGVGLLAVADLAATGVLARTVDWLRWHEDSDRRIALRTYWFVPRKPHLRVDGGLLTLVLPGYFGRTEWTVPLDQIAVDALGAPADRFERVDGDTEDVFVDDIRVPYFPTTSTMTDGTLLLLFRRPVRVPALRRLAALSSRDDGPGIGYLESRRGVYVDGVYLRPVHALSAYTRLVAAGAEPADDPLAWLRAHRRVSADPGERAEVTRRIAWARRLRRSAGAVLFLAFGAGFVLQVLEDLPAWGQIAECVAFAGAWWLRRLARQVRQVPRADGTAGDA